MGIYILSREADADILDIADNSVQQWGFARAEKYILDLHETFQKLADFPGLGRDASHIRQNYLRMEAGSHSIFFQKTVEGILIIRVLHERMDFTRHI